MTGHHCCVEIVEPPKCRATFLVQHRSSSCYKDSTARPGEAWRGPVELYAARHGKVWQGGGVRPTQGKPLPATQLRTTGAAFSRRLSFGTSTNPSKPYHCHRRLLVRAHAVAAVRVLSLLIPDRRRIAPFTRASSRSTFVHLAGHWSHRPSWHSQSHVRHRVQAAMTLTRMLRKTSASASPVQNCRSRGAGSRSMRVSGRSAHFAVATVRLAWAGVDTVGCNRLGDLDGTRTSERPLPGNDRRLSFGSCGDNP